MKRKHHINYYVIALLCMVAAYAGFTGTWMLTHHFELKKSGVDGALFLNLFHNLQQGNGLVSSLRGNHHWFALHFSPILYLIYPLYLLYPHIELLYFTHTFLFAIAAIPIFFTARILFRNDAYALAASCLYFINPFVFNAAIWDFHEIAFAPFLVACTLWAFFKPSRVWTVIFSCALIAVKDHYGFGIFGLGLAWAWHYKEYRFAAWLAALGLCSFALILGVVMPYFSPMGAAMMMSEHSPIDRFSWIMHPFSEDSPLPTLLPAAIEYGVALLMPFLFFPVFACFVLLIAGADLAANSLSANEMMRSPFSYHSAAIIPALIIATAYALTIRRKLRANPGFWLGAVAALSLWFGYSMAALPYNKMYNIWEFTTPKLHYDKADKEALEAIEKLIPPDAHVSAQNNVIPYLQSRSNLHDFPNEIQGADYIVLYTALPLKHHMLIYSSAWKEEFGEMEKIINRADWGIALYQNHWLVLQKNAKTYPASKRKALADIREAERAMEVIAAKTNP